MSYLRYATLFILCTSVLTSCQNCVKKPDAPPKIDIENAKRSAPVKLNYDGLTEPQIDSINKLFSEEICPCGCPKTLGQCIEMQAGCAPAKALAEWSVKQLKEGAPEHLLYRAISDEISNGYLAKEVSVDTKGAHRKGKENAPFVIVEFADFECGACQLASSEIKAFFEENQDEVQMYFMHLPLSNHLNAERAAIAAEAAGKQGKFWQMHDLLFAHPEPLTDDAIAKLAQTLFKGATYQQFEKDRADPALLKKIRDHKDYAVEKLHLAATPTFLFNGRPYNLSSAKDGYQLRLEMEKARTSINCQDEPKS